MQRRHFLHGLLAVPLVAVLPAALAADPELMFDEMYAGSSVLGLRFSDKLNSLSGKKIRVRGFMAPPLKAEAKFLILTKEPVSLCPFCNSDQDWPDSIILVRLSGEQAFVQNNRLIEVSGRLETGSETDPETGFVSLVRLVDAQYKVI